METRSLRPLFTKQQIYLRVQALAERINNDYAGRKPVVIAVLKGAVVFCCDLLRYLELDTTLDFIQVQSYGKGHESSGRCRLLHDIGFDIADSDVLIVEDIVDTGLTLSFIYKHLASMNPASLTACALVDKPSRRTHTVSLRYAGFTLADGFVVGCGLDYRERYRSLPALYALDGIPPSSSDMNGR